MPPDLEIELVNRLRGNAVRLTPFPAIATRLRKVASDPHVSMGDLGAVLRLDPALAAMVVSRAAIIGPITTLVEALELLDLPEVIELALAIDAERTTVASSALSRLRRVAWRCALLSARLAEELAPARHIAAGEAYLAALLHDLGALVVVATLEDLAAEAPLPALPAPAWAHLLARLGVEFGAVTATRMGLPEPLVDVIAHHSPSSLVAHLVALVDRVVAALELSPGSRMAALGGISELTPDERVRIIAVLSQVDAQMETFVPPATRFIPIVVPTLLEGEPAWPIDLEVTMRAHSYRASLLSPSAIVFTGHDELTPNWLVEVAVGCAPTPLKMLVNIVRCVPARGGGYQITARPFALAGDTKTAWLALVRQMRYIDDIAPVSHAVAR